MHYSVLQTDPVSHDPRFRRLADAWSLLLDRHLPHREPSDPFYRYNRPLSERDPAQGWKLHVSATLLSACEVFSAIMPILARSEVRFKAIESLITLKRVNCGSFFGYRQIGKFVAVFARDESEALALADALHRATAGMTGPSVPSDLPYRADGIVFYRYGAFRALRPGSQRCDSIRAPDGELVPDLREPGRSVPSWAANPFPAVPDDTSHIPLSFGFLPYQIISVRGKGAVHRALDVRESPARLVILKEGIRGGEIDLDLRDGYGRLADELSALTTLGALGLPVPRVIAEFRSRERLYAAMEHLDGESLQTLLVASDAPVALDVGLSICLQTTRWLLQLHGSGWVWRDCKPQNLIVGKNGTVRAIDFEEATRADAPAPLPAGTRAYLPPEWPSTEHLVAQDLYALGVTFHQTLSRSIRQSIKAPLEHYRDDLPLELRSLVARLLSADPLARPIAGSVVETLERICDRRCVTIEYAASLLTGSM